MAGPRATVDKEVGRAPPPCRPRASLPSGRQGRTRGTRGPMKPGARIGFEPDEGDPCAWRRARLRERLSDARHEEIAGKALKKKTSGKSNQLRKNAPARLHVRSIRINDGSRSCGGRHESDQERRRQEQRCVASGCLRQGLADGRNEGPGGPFGSHSGHGCRRVAPAGCTTNPLPTPSRSEVPTNVLPLGWCPGGKGRGRKGMARKPVARTI